MLLLQEEKKIVTSKKLLSNLLTLKYYFLWITLGSFKEIPFQQMGFHYSQEIHLYPQYSQLPYNILC